MSSSTGKEFENQSREERAKAFREMLDSFFSTITDDEKAEFMAGVLPGRVGRGMPMMEKMCRQMMDHPRMGRHWMSGMMFGQENPGPSGKNTSSAAAGSADGLGTTSEIYFLFEDWVRQVQEEIDEYRKEHKNASHQEIAQYLKISEDSLAFFIKDPQRNTPSSSDSKSDSQTEDSQDPDYEVIRIKKISSVCPICENYAAQQAEKPIVVMSCEGACLRGEVSRQAANILCHSLAPEKTVRLCLGGAFTKDGGQRDLVRNAERVIALEGCFIQCASRMMKGVVPEVEPEIILTDDLFSFDSNLFGIDEMPPEDIRTNAEVVARKILEIL